ncbi:hypothetical protein A9G07_05040 [Gilliamella sp. wkB72]|uniref:hypothetical protein n=1 Tax=Gilliamella sp. wkB72 TaxID=3120265 RepID=UPI000810B38D|nr:hypothetical protein [Gilliamella apicola]OCL24206.1 hypothetical protein A9G07_05040 [Gilliamella apicola]
MSGIPNINEYTVAKKAVFMAVSTQLHADFIKEHTPHEPKVGLNLETSMKLAKVFLDSIELEGESIETLKCEIKDIASKAIDTVFNGLFNEKGATDATYPLSRH